MARVKWTTTVEVTYEEEVPDAELYLMIDQGTYADDLADHEADVRAISYEVPERTIIDIEWGN